MRCKANELLLYTNIFSSDSCTFLGKVGMYSCLGFICFVSLIFFCHDSHLPEVAYTFLSPFPSQQSNSCCAAENILHVSDNPSLSYLAVRFADPPLRSWRKPGSCSTLPPRASPATSPQSEGTNIGPTCTHRSAAVTAGSPAHLSALHMTRFARELPQEGARRQQTVSFQPWKQ